VQHVINQQLNVRSVSIMMLNNSIIRSRLIR